MAIGLWKGWSSKLLLALLSIRVFVQEGVVVAHFPADWIRFGATSWGWVISILLEAGTLTTH